jgi:hypothetical protein
MEAIMIFKKLNDAFDKSIIVDKARTGNIHVRFIKANGEERLMRCTLKNEHLPKQIDLEESTTKDNPNLVVVWDLDADGWRSFKVDSIRELWCE